MVALILAIFSSILAMIISVDSLMFIILPLMEKSAPWVNHLLFWPSLAVSVWIGRIVFYAVFRYISAENEKAQEVSK